MNKVVWGLVVLLIILHQDVWFWEDRTLWFGFLPVGLAFHVGISLAAAATWYLATLYCWPDDVELLATEEAPANSGESNTSAVEAEQGGAA